MYVYLYDLLDFILINVRIIYKCNPSAIEELKQTSTYVDKEG